MASLGNSSMASYSERSVDVIKRVNASGVDDSMMSGSDVQIVTGGAGNTTIDDANISMAGLSDVSMGEVDIRRMSGLTATNSEVQFDPKRVSWQTMA